MIRAACARFALPTLLTSTIHVRPVGGSTYLPCAKHSSHSKVIINSPALVGRNQLSGATPTLFIGRQHATGARRGAPRRVPLFKPTLRLETPEKESRTRLFHSHRAVRALVFPHPFYLQTICGCVFGENGRPKCGRMEQRRAASGCPWVAAAAAAEPWRGAAARGLPLPARTHARGQRQRPTRLVGSRAASWHLRGTRHFIWLPAALALLEHRLLPR